MDINIFQYGFIVRGLEAGIIVALIAPLIGIFLVLRRYSLITDTLAHVSLAGIAMGLVLRLDPIITGLGTAVISSLGIERLRNSKRVYGESALALFLSGSLALAVIILSLQGIGYNIYNYLFGSIVTITASDVTLILILALAVIATLIIFYKELVYLTFDEEAARVSGVPARLVNTILIVLAALTISLSIPVVGALLIAALIVIPVVTALQLRLGFKQTLIYAEIISVISVISGVMASFYLSLPSGAVIIMIMLIIFALIYLLRRK